MFFPDKTNLNDKIRSVQDNISSLGFSENKILAIENGGTGRPDGFSQDIILEETNGEVVSAKSLGQIGNPVYLGEVDADTLIKTGVYYVDISDSLLCYVNHWPTQMSAKTLVRVSSNNATSNPIFTQLIENEWGTWIRRKYGKNWDSWRPYFIKTGSLYLYISKNGSDTNTGLSPDYPVLTIDRAIEIANSRINRSTSAAVYFRIGAGDWGDKTFANLPYLLYITPYDGNTPTEYSEDLPRFHNIRFMHSFGVLIGFVGNKIYADSMGYISIDSNYKRFAGVESTSGSLILFEAKKDPTNLWEMVNPDSSINTIFIGSHGRIYISSLNIRLAEDITNSSCFLNIQGNGNFTGFNGEVSFDYNGHTFSGQKLFCAVGTSLNTNESSVNSNGIPNMVEDFFGTGYTIRTGVIFNGISNNAVRKSGDTMTGPLTFTTTNAAKSSNVYNCVDIDFITRPDVRYGYFVEARDKNALRFHTYTCRQYGSGTVQLLFALFNYNIDKTANTNAFYTFQLKDNGESTLILPPVPASARGHECVTAIWVNSKLGTGASLASLANLDESSDDYIETLDIKKQKAIGELNVTVQQAIYSDFPYSINGEDYLFGYSLFDQVNLQGKAIKALYQPQGEIQLLCHNEFGESVQLNLTAKQFMEIFTFAEENKQSILNEASDKKNKIMLSNNEEELQSVFVE